MNDTDIVFDKEDVAAAKDTTQSQRVLRKRFGPRLLLMLQAALEGLAEAWPEEFTGELALEGDELKVSMPGVTRQWSVGALDQWRKEYDTLAVGLTRGPLAVEARVGFHASGQKKGVFYVQVWIPGYPSAATPANVQLPILLFYPLLNERRLELDQALSAIGQWSPKQASLVLPPALHIEMLKAQKGVMKGPELQAAQQEDGSFLINTAEVREFVRRATPWIRIFRDFPPEQYGKLPEAEPPAQLLLPQQTHNLILYGPPGTGKTYQVKARALQWIGVEAREQSEIQRQFSEYLNKGQLEFVTFHQSYGYEDFVEGIRPVSVNGQISYPVRDGVFKRMAKRAKDALKAAQQSQAADTSFQARWAALLENGETIKSKNSYIYKLTPGERGDKVVLSYGEDSQCLVSKEEMELLWKKHSPKKPASISVSQENFGPNMTYKWALYNALYQIFPDQLPSAQAVAVPQFVLIIDEINRGNISKIFGELITLLEPDKRLGAEDELTVRLPFSDEEERFGVPPNLHVLGTMNTADRSIALLDIALRRRFLFEEVMPDVGVLEAKLNGSEHGVLICKVFTTLNQRICELYDRDHQLGHALFLKAETLPALHHAFMCKILPLLQEYFYGEHQKISRILGKSRIWIELSKVKVDDYGEERILYGINPEFKENSDLQSFFERLVQ
jgi:hypothetical protein